MIHKTYFRIRPWSSKYCLNELFKVHRKMSHIRMIRSELNSSSNLWKKLSFVHFLNEIWSNFCQVDSLDLILYFVVFVVVVVKFKFEFKKKKSWRRETIVREFHKNGIKGDVIYFSPCGKKLRSFQDIERVILFFNFFFLSNKIFGLLNEH